MLRVAHPEDKEKIIHYLSGDIDNCVYMYIDINTYDICCENINVWIEEKKNAIELVLLKYYDSFQVYSHKMEIDTQAVLRLIEQYQVSMISGPERLIRQIAGSCFSYTAAYGKIFVANYHAEYVDATGIECAKEEDAKEIAELLCTDVGFGRNYTEDVLARQLADRIRLGLGRSYIIRDRGRIVAHIATFAEAPGIAVSSGSIVRPEYRKGDFFLRLGEYLDWILYQEGKKVYSFATVPKMIKWLSYCQTECGEYGKLVKIK